MTLTKEQQISLKGKHDRSNQNLTYLQFRRSVVPEIEGCILVKWCGMWLGIETDGYTHS